MEDEITRNAIGNGSPGNAKPSQRKFNSGGADARKLNFKKRKSADPTMDLIILFDGKKIMSLEKIRKSKILIIKN